MWTLLQDIEQSWSLADVSSDKRVDPLQLSTTICWWANIAQWSQPMQSSGTSGSSELLQLVPLHSVHTSLQCRPCCRHVHLFVLHSFLQLQYMMSSSSAGAACLTVCIGRHFPSTMCHPLFFWLHTVTSSFPVHYMIVHSKAVVQCSRWGLWQSTWFHMRCSFSNLITEPPVCQYI